MRYKVITPPAAEPVSLADAKLHLRADGTAEDTLISNLIVAAREHCEDETRRALVEQTIEAYPQAFGDPLPRPPMRDVLSVVYKDSSGVEHTLTAGQDYLVDIVHERLVLPPRKSWPVFEPYPVSPITIQYTAGYDSLPKTIRQAMLLLIGHWYVNREAVGTVGVEIEMAVKRLLTAKKARW
ncbi:MAG: head-tail connector protein [Bacillota bacterium]